MKRTEPSKTNANATPGVRLDTKSNGRTATAGVRLDRRSTGRPATGVEAEPVSADLSVILASLQTMRDGDFSVRLPGNWTGLAGKIADTFNDIVTANQQMAKEL